MLEWAEVPFEIMGADTERVIPCAFTALKKLLYILPADKALAIQQKSNSNKPIIAADTIVVLQNDIIGKPKSREDAVNILTRLAGNQHRAVTGVVILNAGKETSFANVTAVQFHPFDQSAN
ncbi:Maf family protein [Ferruginibacter sp.]